MEALLLAGGKAERLGEAAQGLPKPLVPVAGFDALRETHERSDAAATLVVAQVRSPFGVVDIEDGGRITGFSEAPLLDDWVNTGVYVLGPEALERLPERGDHEQSTFPELAREGKLHGFRHRGVWLTVNTPKDLRRAA